MTLRNVIRRRTLGSSRFRGALMHLPSVLELSLAILAAIVVALAFAVITPSSRRSTW